jgi:photosystem II stability/assembly factor-like uncharacterized protein
MRSRILIILLTVFVQTLFAQIVFHPLEGPSGGLILDMQANSSGELFAITTKAVYKSVDGSGASWDELAPIPITSNLIDLYIDNNDKIYVLNNTGVAYSTDGGTSWTQNTATGTFKFVKKIMKNHQTNSLFVIGEVGSLYGLARSTDDGLTWIGSYSADQVNDFTIKQAGTFGASALGDIYLATNSNKVQKNSQNGSPINWAVAGTGIVNSGTNSIEVNKFNGNIYTISYSSGTYISVNNGGVWSLVTGGNPANLNYSDSEGSWQVYTSANSDRWFVVYNDDKNNQNAVNKLFTSSVANPTTAASWAELTTLATENPITSLYSFSTTILVSTNFDGILKSTNTGASWSVADYGIPQAASEGFLLATDTELLSAHGTNRVTYSFDNNHEPTFKTEKKPVTAGRMTSFVKLGTNSILAIGSQTYISADNGNTYTLRGTQPGTVILNKAYRHSDTEIYAIGSMVGAANNVYKTTTQGTSWAIHAITGLPANRQIEQLSTTSNGDLYIRLKDNGTTNRIYRVPNASLVATLLTIPTFTQYTSIAAIGTKIYALGFTNSGSVLAISTNAAGSWATKPATPTENLFAVHDGVLFATQNNDAYLSNDEGDNWDLYLDLTGGSGQEIVGVALDSKLRAIVGISKGPFQMSSGAVVRPNQPLNLKSIGTGSAAVYLQWDYTGPPTVNTFYVERKLGAGGTFSEVANIGSSNRYFRDLTVAPSSNYVYRIKAVNDAGTVYSAELAVNTPANTCASTIPDNRSWTGTIPGAVTNTAINIKKISGQLYSISDVVSNSLNTAPHNVAGPIATTFFENCGLPFINKSNILYPNATGTWNGTNTLVLNWQTDVSVNTSVTKTITLTLNSAANEPAPDAPTGVKAYATSSTTASVSWNSGNYQHQYIIERATNSGFTLNLTSLGTVDYPQTSIADSGPLSPGTTYFYRVRAENIDNDLSANSTAFSLAFAVPYFILSNTTVSSTSLNASMSIWNDFDNDGDEDLMTHEYGFISPSETEPVFFKNDGTGNFAIQSGGGNEGAYATSIAGDYNNDGLNDIFTFGSGSFLNTGIPKKSVLLKNNGSFNFSPVAGTPFDPNLPIPTTASWVDVNNDGKLDLYLGYLSGTKLYIGNGAGGFTEKTTDPLIIDSYEPSGAVWADYDSDKDQDVFILNDNGANRLYKNDGAGNFTYVTGSAFDLDPSPNSSAASFGDYDNDGDQDLYVMTSSSVSTPGSNLLYRNNGNGTFSKVAVAANTPTESKTTPSTACAWGDIDNDGDLDLVVSYATDNDVPAPGAGIIYLNNGTGVFTKVTGSEYLTAGANFVFPLANAFADYDNDGFLDLAVGEFAFSENGSAIKPKIKLLKNNHTSANYLKLKLVGTSSNANGIGARVKITANSKTQYRQVQSLTSRGSQNSMIVHFGIGAATSVSDVIVEWPSGVVQNFGSKAINQTHTLVEDAEGPAALTLSPANNAINVSTTTSVSITLNENSTAIAGKFLLVYLHSDLANALTGVNLSAAVKSGNTYTFTLPVTLLEGTQYNISVDAGAFLDDFGNPSLEFPTGLWTFTTAAAIDATAPVITLGPEIAPSIGFGTRPKQVTVTDNVGVASVVVSIRKISGSAFTEVPAVQGTDLTKWNIVLSEANHFDATGTELFVTATDAAGNSTRSPATGTHKIYLTYEGDQAATIDSDHIGFGGTKASWKVFSVPFELGSNNAVTTIFDEVTQNAELKTKVDYSLLTIQNGGTDWTVYPNFSTINRGQGYFINIKTATTIKVPSATAPTNSRDNLFKINLAKGWNMVGNPYLTSISWANVATLNGLSGDAAEILKYNGTSYASGVQTLEPWEGAFVFSAAAVSDVDIPFLGQTTSGGRKGYKGLGSDINADEWMVKLNLNQGERSYELGAIGMSPDASTSYDEFDAVTPPRFFDYLEMNFAHPEFFAKRFTRDVVPTQNAYTWEFSVDAALGEKTTLNWDNSAFSSSTKDIFLLDVTRQVLLSMKETNSYSFNPKESANFKVFFGEDLRIAPERVQLGKAYPNPTSGLTTVAFSLPESEGMNQQVTLDIVDATGRPMGVLKQGLFNPGYHEVAFDAKELTIGFYLYRLSVQGQKGKTSHVNKLIIK